MSVYDPEAEHDKLRAINAEVIEFLEAINEWATARSGNYGDSEHALEVIEILSRQAISKATNG